MKMKGFVFLKIVDVVHFLLERQEHRLGLGQAFPGRPGKDVLL
jgi:hypothetical protein